MSNWDAMKLSFNIAVFILGVANTFTGVRERAAFLVIAGILTVFAGGWGILLVLTETGILS